MTKRTRRDVAKEDIRVPIGASEFAMIVNQAQGGPHKQQDQSTLLVALRRFVRTVQRDRRMAIGREEEDLDADSLSDDSSCTSSFENLGEKKRAFNKGEAWKEDSAAYGVPFVGTSVASMRSDSVIQGQWPTGLLNAYLTKSPLAIELTGETLNSPEYCLSKDGQEHRGENKLMEAIRKAYLLALAELCTAAVPFSSTGESRKNDEEPRFVSEVLSKRLPHLLSLLGEGTNHGKGLSTVAGGCGALVAPVLTILERLALVSTRTARYVARSVEQNVSESVVRFILTPQQQTQRPDRHPQHAMERDPEDKIDHNDAGYVSRLHRDKARVAALQLAATLAAQDDPVVISCISSTSDTKDRKIRRGILFLSMQRGIQLDDFNNNPGYNRVVARLLRVVCGLLERTSVSKRLLSDLFSLDFVQKLVHLSMQAPTLSSNVTFAHVLAGVDSYRRSDDNARKGNAKAREQTAIEARRLLFVLLGDTERSPLFYSLAKNRFTQLHEQCIVRSMIQLLDCSDDPDREIRRFVIDITNRVPSLFPAVLRVLTLPDDNHPFALVARLNSLTALLRDGPSASACLGATRNARPSIPHHSTLCFLPLALRRQLFAKFIQSRNHLVAFVSLKLYMLVLERCRNFLADNVLSEDDLRHVAEALAQGLPDEAMLIAALSRLDFGKRADAVLFGYICEGIRACSTVFRGRPIVAKFDWTQLLPEHATVFCQAPLFLQKIILASVRAILPLQETGCAYSFSSSQVLCDILLRTQSVEIFQLSRSVLVGLISRLLSQTGSGGEIGYTTTSREHEAACWVDGVNHSTAADLCRLIHKTSLAPLPTAVSFLRVWREVGLKSKSFPGILPSRILAQAFCDISRSSKSFVLLVVQVSTKCLLFDSNSMPLATLIAANSQEVEASCVGGLVAFVRSIVFCDQNKATSKILFAKQALVSCFSSNSNPLNFFTDTPPNNLSCSLPELNFKNSKANDISALIRYLIGFASMSKHAGHNHVFDLVERLLPQAISSSMATSAPPPLSLQTMDYMRNSSSSRNIFLGCILTSSFLPVQQGAQFIKQNLKAICTDNAVSKNLRDHFYFYVLGPFLSADVLISSTLCLLPEGRKAEFYARESPEGRLLRQYFKLTIKKVEWMTVDRLTASKLYSSILSFWLSFTDVHLSDRNLNALSRNCETLLGLSLSRSFSPFLLRMRSSDILLQQCLVTKLSRIEQETDLTSNALMANLIDTDPVRFGPSFLSIHMRRMEDPNYLRIFYGGCLDKEICSVFDCQGFDKPPEAVDALGEMLAARSQDICSSYSRPNAASIDCFLSVLLAFTVDVKILERVPVSSHILLASTLLNEGGVEIVHTGDWSRMQKILLLTLRLCRRKTEGIALGQIALLWCAKALPLALKASDTDSPATPRRLIQYLEELIEVNLSSDKRMVGNETSKHFPRLALSCLDFSMGSIGNGRQSDRAKCLNVVQALVHCLRNNPNLSGSPSFEFSHFARTVFERLVAHSKFTDVLRGESSDSEGSASLETLRLMKTCLMATNEIFFDERVWRQLLACYDAGVSVKDLYIRWILHLFTAKAPSYLSCTITGQLRWGNAVDSSAGWDWLVESIDLYRVYTTLDCFPVHDRLVLESDHIYETYFHPTEENDSKPYSPGFLLPVVLKALADDQVDRNATAESDVGSAVSWKGKASGLMLAQRLCEKGVLALALVSLCSNDISLRKTAVAILGALLENVGSDDALRNPYWRDRPQLAMVLNSVQRSLVIRQIRDSDIIKGSEGQTNFVVPKLPGFSAVFLARASLVVCRPTDQMFVAINRALLRGESDFGAFQDLTRVPVFVSMFCSASSDPEQLKMERRFALQLVGDGITEEADYRLLMACHCPELLLSSLGRICTYYSTDQDDESCDIFKVLTKLIRIGGVHAVSHIVDRMGLLSWLRSLLCEVNRTKHGPSQSVRTEILLLLAQVVGRANDILTTKELVAATSGMAQSVLSLTCDTLYVSSESIGQYGYKSHNQLIKQACAVLSLLQTVFLNNDSARSRACLQPDGFLMETASQFLSTVTTAKELEAAVCAFCILPINDNTVDGSHVEAFCMKILIFVTSEILPTLRRQTKAAVLHRFCVMLNRDWMSDMKNREKLLNLFLAFWTSCALDSELREDWYQCADRIVSSLIGSNSSIDEGSHDDVATFLFRIHSIACNKS